MTKTAAVIGAIVAAPVLAHAMVPTDDTIETWNLGICDVLGSTRLDMSTSESVPPDWVPGSETFSAADCAILADLFNGLYYGRYELTHERVDYGFRFVMSELGRPRDETLHIAFTIKRGVNADTGRRAFRFNALKCREELDLARRTGVTTEEAPDGSLIETAIPNWRPETH